jgi:hypothetical protein
MVGSATLEAALADDAVTHVTALVRRKLSVSHPKLEVIVHEDFLNYQRLETVFAKQHACLWCLGISQTRVKSDEEYNQITYDYTINAAKSLLHANPGIAFIFVSGAGADQGEQSRTLFARIKGKTENALKRLPFKPKKLYLLRPAAITPGPNGNPNGPWVERMLYPLHPFFKLFFPKYFIKVTDLAQVILRIAKQGAAKQLLHNSELLELIEREKKG